MYFPGAGSTTNVEETRDIELTGDRFIPFVDEFCYLGSMISTDLTDDADIKYRIRLAKGAKARLEKRVLRSRSLSLNSKTRAVGSLILSILLYGAENWALTSTLYRELEVFYNDCLRSCLRTNRYKAHYMEHMTREDLYEKCEMPPLSTMIHLRRARRLEKMARMPDTRIQRKLLSAWINLPRPTGRPQKSTRGAFADTLIALNMSPDGNLAEWIPLARDPVGWAKTVEQTLNLKEGSYRRLRPSNEN